MNTANYDENCLAHALSQAKVDFGQTCFVRLNSGETMTYSAFFANAERTAAMLINQGLKPGDRVAVQVEKSIQAVELYFATILAGGVFLPLNTAYTDSELAYFLSDAEPVIFVCDSSRLTSLEPVASHSGVKTTLTLDQDGSGTLTELTAEQQDPDFTAVRRDPDDLAAILYTSGTTGRSKGAMLTHRNLASNARTLKDYWQFTERDRLIHALPIFHVHGLFIAINVTLIAGASLLFHHRFDVQAVLDDFKHATALMAVPTFYVRLLETTELDQQAVDSMRVFISGSAPLLEEIHHQWRSRTGHGIVERYGMTETGMNTSNPYDGERRAGTVGFPLPDIEVIVANRETGAPLPVNEVGSVEVRGPNVFQGYWRMPEKTAEEIRETGFFITGDLGCYDDRGYLSIVGRSKDLIISGGYNVYPREVELLIDDLPGVNESAVIGLPHPDFGEGVAAVIVKQNGMDITEQDISEALTPKLARFKQPKKIFFMEELPRNTMGKVQKKTLRENYMDTFKA